MLVIFNFPFVKEKHRVVQVFAFGIRIFGWAAQHDGDVIGFLQETVYAIISQLDKVIKFEEVAGRVATGGQLSKADDVGSLRLCHSYRLQHFLQVAFEVTDVVVDLGQGYFHGMNLQSNIIDLTRNRLVKDTKKSR